MMECRWWNAHAWANQLKRRRRRRRMLNYLLLFYLGGYLLEDGIAGLLIEAEILIDYCYLGNWTSFTMMYISLMYDFGLLRNFKFKWWKLSFVGEYTYWRCISVYFHQFHKIQNVIKNKDYVFVKKQIYLQQNNM